MSKGLKIMNAVADTMAQAEKDKGKKPTQNEKVVDGNDKEQASPDSDDAGDAPSSNGPKLANMSGKKPAKFGKEVK